MKDLIQHDKIVERVYIARKNMKGRSGGRSVLVHPSLHPLIWEVCKDLAPSDKVFPIERCQAWRIIKAAANKAQLQGKIGTHSMRKTFADKVYKKSGKDIIITQRALGHKDLNNTAKYLSFLTSEVDDVILGL